MKDSHDLSFGIGSQVSYLVLQCIVCPWRTWYSLIPVLQHAYDRRDNRVCRSCWIRLWCYSQQLLSRPDCLSHYFTCVLLRCIIRDYREFVLLFFALLISRAAIVGRANSLLKPIYYILIFSSFDVIALVVQAIGGAGAAQAEVKGTNTGNATHIMVTPPLFKPNK